MLVLEFFSPLKGQSKDGLLLVNSGHQSELDTKDFTEIHFASSKLSHLLRKLHWNELISVVMTKPSGMGEGRGKATVNV